jgi:hypothetical protein
MKTTLAYAITIALSIFFTNCKRDTNVDPSPKAKENDIAVTSITSSEVPQNSVITIAGSPYKSGATLINGSGKSARFNNPRGIQLMDDGTIYVADTYNNVIRTVSPAAVVSTFGIPKPGDIKLYQPKYIGITKSGIVNVIDMTSASDEARVYDSNGTLVTTAAYIYANFNTLTKDPYEDVFWFNQGLSIQKFLSNGMYERIGTDPLQFTNKYLPPFPELIPFFRALAVGYNKVTYFTFHNQIYKHTPEDVGQLIFPDLQFTKTTSIVINKDSRTIYVADGGYIRRIDDGRMTTIAGPNKTFTDSRDGVGFKADVDAQYLALSKDEGTLYFSDALANAIRKIILR